MTSIFKYRNSTIILPELYNEKMPYIVYFCPQDDFYRNELYRPESK